MGNDIFNRRKFSLLTSTALTRQAATFSALGLAFSAGSAFALDPNALPVDPNVVGGAATFNQSGATLTVNQSTNRTVIDWRSFDIGSNATTNFVQPNSSSIAVNRVNGSANPTEIQGTLNANGQVWILNPNGVLFGKNAQIDVAGIVASTGNISVQSFMSGDTRLQLSGADGGSVTNEGAITIADGGLAAFVAPAVRNSGVIQARVGKVTLAAGTTFTLDLAGDQLVEIGLGANNALVDQSGQLIAEGSTVNLTAKSASAVVDSVVNVSGTVLASGVHEDGGAIVLTADNVTTTGDAVLRADGGTNGNGGTITAYANKSGSYDGTFSAKGGAEGGNGGAIETSGKKVEIASTISVNTLAPRGETGNWTIDPDDLTVTDGANAGSVGPDASTITNGTVVNQLLTTNVTLAANNSITVNGAINSSGAGDLALNDQNPDGDLTINLNATIKLGSGKTLSGQGSVVNVANSGSIQNGVDVAKVGGATVNVAAGTYNENVTINKSGLSLLSTDGRDATKIVGQGSSALGTVLIASGANNVALGSIGHGFEIVGIDNASAGIESAAVYFQGANSGSTVAGNRITANGDGGLTTEYNVAVTNLTVDGNIFDGKTFSGDTAGGLGFGTQFATPNVPRQLVVISGGPTVTNTKDITFTNNQVIGTAGGLNADGQEQGNSLVTIDAVGATITGNTFAGTTTRYGDALRARGTNTVVTGNTFDGANMGSGTNMLNLTNSALTGTFADVLANNTWVNGSVWLDHAVANVNYVFRGIQNAINAATAGDTVNVGAGTYREALGITKNLSVVGAGADETIIRPDALLTTGVAHKYDANMKVAVFVNGASDVNLSGMTIDGNNLGANAVVFWNNASGTISDAVIKNPSSFSGLQTGQGLAVDATGANTSNLTVTNVAFENWNKNAIDAVTGGGSTSGGGNINLTVKDSTLTGRGENGTNAQNGILLWERGGAGSTVNATIDNVVFNDLVYTGSNSSAGLLVYGSPNGQVTVSNSTFDNIQTYIALSGGSAKNLDATVGNVFDGVDAATATLDQLFDIENHLQHKLDDTSNGLIRVKEGQVFVTAEKGNIQAGVSAASVGDTVNVQAGTYNDPRVSINTAGINLAGQQGAKIVVPSVTETNAIDVWANDVTIQGFEITGPAANESYLTYAWGGTVTRGIAIHNGVTNFTIKDNYIHGLRNNILIDGRNTGSVTNNIIDNSKSGISVQYTDAGAGNSEGYAIDISGNSEGEYGNEWGMNTHLNGHYVGATHYETSQKIAANATATVQQALLDASAANGGWTVQDQGYSNSNRTAVTVSATGSDSNQGSALGSLQTIQAGVNAVVAGGTVNVKDGTYVISSGYLSIGKSLNLIGESEAGTIIDAHGASSYGLRVIGGTSDVNLSDFTLYGVVAAGGYGIKVEDSQNVNITNVTSKGAYKAQIDLNGVRGGTLDNVTADGTPSAWGSGSTKGAAIAITDSQDILVKNSSTNGGSYGGIAIYQSNKASGYSYQVDNVTIAASNSYGEANPVYMQDESATNNFGAVTVEGFDYIARNTNPADAYTWFQKTQQGAIDIAAAASGYVEGWLGSAGNNIFTVGYNTAGTVALSINNAINAASNGATINVAAGTYGAFGTSFGGASDVTIQSADGAVIDGTGLTGRIIDLRADGTKLTGFTVNGDGGGVGVSISGRDVTVSGNTINGTLTGVQTTTQYAAGNATISGNTIDTAYGISLQNTGNTVSNNNVTASVEGVGLLKSANTFTDNTFDIGASGNAMVLYGASASDLNAARNSVNIAGGALQGAVDLAGTDGDLNLAAGNYTLASTLNINKSGLTLDGAGEGLTNITSNATGYGLLVNADDVTLSSFTLNGPASGLYGIKVEPSTGAASDRLLNFAIDHVTINGSKKTGLDLNGVNGATIDHVTVRNTTNGNGIALTDSADVTITNSKTSNNAWGGLALYQTNKVYDQQVTDIRVDGTNTFDEANGIYAQDQSATNDFGVIDLAGQGIAYVAKIATGGTDGDYTFFQKLKQGAYDIGDAFNTRYGLTGATVQGYAEANKSVEGNNTFYVGHATGGGALSVNAAVQSSVSGDTVNVDAGTYNEDVVVDGASRNLAFNGSTLDSLTTNVATAIGGTVTAAGGFLLNAATTLLSDTVLNGAVTAGAIDGTTAGGQSLAINGGSGAVTLGNLGATTRLGAVSVTGTGMTTFNGSSYIANSLHFGGPATLTKALTTFDTSAAGGDITFSGPLFGTADSAQSVAFLAGSGTGGANGDISIQNAGTDSIWLGSMTVRGDDFSGATVYVGGDYNALLTGDQTFTTDTLHTKGSVTSTVGGDATGPIVSGGNVGVNAGGNFSGNVTAPTAEIHGNTITGTFNGGTLTLFADNGVDVIANVTTLNVTSPGGTVDGSFSTINTGGSGPLIVNGKTRTGNNATDPNQIVVEGFTLPAGTIITPSGEIILPSGMMIGLVSPAAGGSAQGGKPKVILVHSVQKLGELLAQGYVAIIVDLSGNKDEEQEIAMAQ